MEIGRFVRRLAKDGAMLACRALAPRPANAGVILMYHSVGSGWGVPSDMFERQLHVLCRSYDVVPLRQLFDAPDSGRPRASITFDDGYEDNFKIALPILQHHEVYATFFIATGFIGGFFQNSMGSFPMMSAEQIRRLARDGHEVGAHGVTHRPLPDLAATEVSEEVRVSRHHLESITDCPVVSFAYPKGRLTPQIRCAVEETGYRYAVTIREGTVALGADPLSLPRVGVLRTTTLSQFKTKLTQGVDLYERMVRR